MKYLIEYTVDQKVGYKDDSDLWKTWTTVEGSLEYAKRLLKSYKNTHERWANDNNNGATTTRYRICQLVVIESDDTSNLAKTLNSNDTEHFPLCMSISELIEQLEVLKEKYGDIDTRVQREFRGDLACVGLLVRVSFPE